MSVSVVKELEPFMCFLPIAAVQSACSTVNPLLVHFGMRQGGWIRPEGFCGGTILRDLDGRICPRRYDNYVLLEELDLNLPASMLCFRINSQKARRFL